MLGGSVINHTANVSDHMLKKFLKPLARSPIVMGLQGYMSARTERRFVNMSPAEVFSEIYRRKMWGSADDSEYCSGQGSHVAAIIEPYIHSVRAFLSAFPAAPNVVDLGCGDFNVGSRLRDCCARFVATDVVRDLVDRNGLVFGHLDVSFRCIDIISEDLPSGEVAFLRQVAQHLTNAQIANILPKLSQYQWIIVSEHLPSVDKFKANLDKPVGSGVRVSDGSGVVLTEPPFNLAAEEARLLCSVRLQEMSGIVQTIAYRMTP
jgi:hypothetical protein